LNQEDPNGGDIINDLKKGKYDCTVTIGPSFQTARQETLQTLIDAAGAIPAVAQLCPDLLAKNIDSPDAAEMARRLRIPLIQQGIIQPTEQEAKQVPQKQPDPMQQLEMSIATSKAQRGAAEARIAVSKASASHLEGERLMYETAGKHLANLLAAKKLGEPTAAQEAESIATSTLQSGQQNPATQAA
jgi:hypothetical protein